MGGCFDRCSYLIAVTWQSSEGLLNAMNLAYPTVTVLSLSVPK